MTDRLLIEDPALSVHDVMDILGVSRSFAYEVMARIGVERFAKKCIRVRRSALESWRKETGTCPRRRAGRFYGVLAPSSPA